MAVTKINLGGQANGSGTWTGTFATDNALFLQVFGGEVLQAFETTTVMKDKHTIRTISSGKSASFPTSGVASVAYHTPGEDIATEASSTYLSNIKHNEKIIYIDKLLLSSVFVDKLDEMKNHYDVRSIYAQEIGRALANQFDKNLIALACLAGQASATSGMPTKNSVAANASYTGAGIVDGLYKAAAALDKNNVPSEDRYAIVTPDDYWTIVNSTQGLALIDRDFGGDSNGAYYEGKLLKVAGIALVKSNNAAAILKQVVSNTQNNTYGGTFTNVNCVAFHKSAVGTVKLMDLSMETEYDMRLQGNLMVAKYAMGSNILRPESAVVLATA
jgi:hypothetical protein